MSVRRPHDLVELMIADDLDGWDRAGFAIVEDTAVIGSTTIRLTGAHEPRGVVGLSVDGIEHPIDGIPFGSPPIQRHSIEAADAHPNRVTAIDHVVVISPDMDRTTEVLRAAGLEARRTRRFEVDGTTRRQTFFWMGATILELAGADDAHSDGPAVVWGLAFTCDDLDAAATQVGDGLGAPRPALQAGRRIATLRTDDLDISVQVALMSPHPSNSCR